MRRAIPIAVAVVAVGLALTTAGPTVARPAGAGTHDPAGRIAQGVRVAAEPEPHSFVRFSSVVAELSEQPGFVEALLARIGRDPAAGGILGREQIDKLRELILGKDWEALDHFPTLSVEEMAHAVRTAAQVQPAVEPSAARAIPTSGRAIMEEPLGIPTGGAPPGTQSFLKPLGFGLVVGDQLDPLLAPREPDGRRLAEVLNRLARNPATGPGPRFRVSLNGRTADTPVGLVRLLRDGGHAIEIRDARYFANFGDLTYKGRDVFTPFWVDTGIVVPGHGRNLRVPVAHSQHEIRVTGPLVDAVLSFYFGIDGKAEFRVIATRDQSWTLGRVARTYRGDQAVEVMRLAGAIVATYDAIQAANPGLPFGGYFALGVCNDANALIELAMQGETSLYPLTRDTTLFPDDTEIGRLARRLPVDGRAGEPTDARRVLATLPVDDLAALPLPDLRRDLEAVRAAYRAGTVERGEAGSAWFRFAIGGVELWLYRNAILAGVVIATVLAAGAWLWRRHRAHAP